MSTRAHGYIHSERVSVIKNNGWKNRDKLIGEILNSNDFNEIRRIYFRHVFDGICKISNNSDSNKIKNDDPEGAMIDGMISSLRRLKSNGPWTTFVPDDVTLNIMSSEMRMAMRIEHDRTGSTPYSEIGECLSVFRKWKRKFVSEDNKIMVDSSKLKESMRACLVSISWREMCLTPPEKPFAHMMNGELLCDIAKRSGINESLLDVLIMTHNLKKINSEIEFSSLFNPCTPDGILWGDDVKIVNYVGDDEKTRSWIIDIQKKRGDLLSTMSSADIILSSGLFGNFWKNIFSSPLRINLFDDVFEVNMAEDMYMLTATKDTFDKDLLVSELRNNVFDDIVKWNYIDSDGNPTGYGSLIERKRVDSKILGMMKDNLYSEMRSTLLAMVAFDPKVLVAGNIGKMLSLIGLSKDSSDKFFRKVCELHNIFISELKNYYSRHNEVIESIDNGLPGFISMVKEMSGNDIVEMSKAIRIYLHSSKDNEVKNTSIDLDWTTGAEHI